ncbi:hypothetical protein RM445_31575 [Pseudonocardia sp. DSM 45834]|uniref:HTH merR-type domain-containing protein n=1 Tax=Pseudonocardia charpentierae TaxID=3075545 RepID=A0ABU2NJ75_9PSEU|nr:MerR family transcriptional regulator [Pseudonocardia sp. DSM 45834]MDT0354026.1 hypothetical protein [Pseudonocardia sp. DSM 45834]
MPTPWRRTRAGYRSYDQDAVARLRFGRSAQALGLSLAEIPTCCASATIRARRAATWPGCSRPTSAPWSPASRN